MSLSSPYLNDQKLRCFVVPFSEFRIFIHNTKAIPRAYLACSECTSESKDCYICSPVGTRRPTQIVDRFAIWITTPQLAYLYIYIYNIMYIWKTHVKIYYIPKLTNSHKWLCTNDIFLSKIRKLFRNDNLQKIDGYLLNNPNHQTKPCQHKSERLISCFPCLLLYWNTTHIGVSPWWLKTIEQRPNDSGGFVVVSSIRWLTRPFFGLTIYNPIFVGRTFWRFIRVKIWPWISFRY